MPTIWTQEEEAARLKARFDAYEGKNVDFARDFGVPGGGSMISQHMSGNRPISLEAAVAYARGFGVTLAEISPRLAELVVSGAKLLSAEESFTPYGSELAHPRSHWSPTMAPQDDSPRVEWGAMKVDDLPEVFLVTVPDNAMAPTIPRGYSVRFDKRLQPRAEDAVLLADTAGNWYFRQYFPSGPGQFEARALNKDYPPMDGAGLTVVAVHTWHGQEGRWG
jgi:hypothetical protein